MTRKIDYACPECHRTAYGAERMASPPDEDDNPFAHPLVPAFLCVIVAAMFVAVFPYLWAAFVWLLKVTP